MENIQTSMNVKMVIVKLAVQEMNEPTLLLKVKNWDCRSVRYSILLIITIFTHLQTFSLVQGHRDHNNHD